MAKYFNFLLVQMELSGSAGKGERISGMFYNLQVSFWYLFFGALLTYLCWGFVVAFEILLAMGGSKWAIEWIRKRYRYEVLYREVKVFYPMIWVGYFFLETLPSLLFNAERTPLDLDALFEKLYRDR